MDAKVPCFCELCAPEWSALDVETVPGPSPSEDELDGELQRLAAAVEACWKSYCSLFRQRSAV